MNILHFLTPKSSVAFLYDTFTLRQGLEKMRYHGYSSIPVISSDGSYLTTVSEGDFLWHLMDKSTSEFKKLEQISLSSILKKDKNPPVSVNTPLNLIFERIINQNFVPVTDDRGAFVGIITRRRILLHFLQNNEAAVAAAVRPRS